MNQNNDYRFTSVLQKLQIQKNLILKFYKNKFKYYGEKGGFFLVSVNHLHSECSKLHRQHVQTGKSANYSKKFLAGHTKKL